MKRQTPLPNRKRIAALEFKFNRAMTSFAGIKENLDKMLDGHAELAPRIADTLKSVAICMAVLNMLKEKGLWSDQDFEEYIKCLSSDAKQTENPDLDTDPQGSATPTHPETTPVELPQETKQPDKAEQQKPISMENPRVAKKKGSPEKKIQQAIMDMLTLKGWFCLSTHGNMFQKGLPDIYATHPSYRQRWIEVKLPEMKGSQFTPAQRTTFAKLIAFGSPIWILTAATEEEYKKLFFDSNYHYYLALKMMNYQMAYVKYRFALAQRTKSLLQELEPDFGYNGFGEFIFYRTYSRKKRNGQQESWADVVIRVIEGTISIRKDWYLRNKIAWDEEYWQRFSHDFAIAMFKMQWLPPGRGMWAMGTPYVYERGAMALYNCAYTRLDSETLGDDIHWMMDALMNGVGVGFGPIRDGLQIYDPGKPSWDFEIPDDREGWCDATRYVIRAFTKPDTALPNLIYDKIRPYGEPIKGFGGLASGPEPLKLLHEQLVERFRTYGDSILKDPLRLKTDIANQVGCCVVAGNVRRSAEIALAPISDETFLDLKNYEIYPEREDWGWMSNNSVILESDKDFEMLPEVAKRVISNGEPGYVNIRNFKYGRIGKDDCRPDFAEGINPCGEIPLENKEVCNLAETVPTRCTEEEWYDACEYASLYCSSVSLLPTHRAETNTVVARNRRIGVGIIDIQNWKSEIGVSGLTKCLRNGYNRVRETNRRVNSEAGVPEAIRVSTLKPGGTGPKLPGCVSGCSNPTFNETLRLVTVAKNSPVFKLLFEAGLPWQNCVKNPQITALFEYPILQKGVSAERVSLWEQAANLVLMQREWADNAVSNTLYFKPRWRLTTVHQNGTQKLYEELKEEHRYRKAIVKLVTRYGNTEVHIYEYDPSHEEHHIEPVLAFIAPLTKSVSLLPHTAQGVYPQMPESKLSVEEYDERVRKLPKIDWSLLRDSDGVDDKYCNGDTCEQSYHSS